MPDHQSDCRSFDQRLEVRILGGRGRPIFFTEVADSCSQNPPGVLVKWRAQGECGGVKPVKTPRQAPGRVSQASEASFELAPRARTLPELSECGVRHAVC